MELCWRGDIFQQGLATEVLSWSPLQPQDIHLPETADLPANFADEGEFCSHLGALLLHEVHAQVSHGIEAVSNGGGTVFQSEAIKVESMKAHPMKGMCPGWMGWRFCVSLGYFWC